MNKRDKWLVTSALPYANGPIHFGHVVGAYLPADIFVRHLRLSGEDVVYICGTDEHGVAITIAAEQAGVTPEEHVDKYHEVIKRIFDNFNIAFDNFSRTTWPPHYKLSQEFFTDLYDGGHINEKESEQFFCSSCNRFLAGRYVMGTCPKCGHETARGDECGKCGAWLEPEQLLEPKCKICGHPPVKKNTTHYYLKLQNFSDKLKGWLDTKKEWKENVKKFISNMIEEGLEERPITRDIDWGIPVPLEKAAGKVLYVWFDAPIGYISSTVQWAEKMGQPDRWKDYWHDPDTKLVHFIGKDNIPFHCIVWPAVIMGQKTEYVLPHNVPANEFLNLEGKPFSKGDNWYIHLDDFFDKYSTDAIRYTLCSNMPEGRDADFRWKDFQARNNSELADIYGNLVNRSLSMIKNYRGGKIPAAGQLSDIDRKMMETIEQAPVKIKKFIRAYGFRKALFEIMELARAGNKYIDEKQPWRANKEDPSDCSTTLSIAAHLIVVMGYVSWPFMPETADKIWKMTGMEGKLSGLAWDDASSMKPPEGQKLGNIDVLFKKIDDELIEEEIRKLHSSLEAVAHQGDLELEPLAENVLEYGKFTEMDLRVGKVVSAERVEKSKKLLRLEVDVGHETRQIVAGIAEHYKASEMPGKNLVIVANLKPRKLMGLESKGMLLAATLNEKLVLATLDGDIPPGARIS